MFISVNVQGNIHNATYVASYWPRDISQHIFQFVALNGGTGSIVVFKVPSREDEDKLRAYFRLSPRDKA